MVLYKRGQFILERKYFLNNTVRTVIYEYNENKKVFIEKDPLYEDMRFIIEKYKSIDNYKNHLINNDGFIIL